MERLKVDYKAEGMTGQFGPAVEKAVADLMQTDPVERAAAAGVTFKEGVFSFDYFGGPATIDFTTGDCRLNGKPAHSADRVLILHYVLEAKEVALGDRWISFREVPDSAAYHAAYQSRGPGLIAQRFGEDAAGFSKAAMAIGAVRDLELPGLAYVVRALPRVPLAMILYEGEPGLPPEAQILFDASAPEIFCAEDLAVVGEMAPIRLIRALKRLAD